MPWFSSMYDVIHGWMTGWTDGWMDGWKASRKMTTMSFTICNVMTYGFIFLLQNSLNLLSCVCIKNCFILKLDFGQITFLSTLLC